MLCGDAFKGGCRVDERCVLCYRPTAHQARVVFLDLRHPTSHQSIIDLSSTDSSSCVRARLRNEVYNCVAGML